MTYVISDIHGNRDAYLSILEQINFTDSDELYILGDVIDRNPYGIDLLLEIMDKPNIHMLLGNHEYMMLQSFGLDPYERNIPAATKQWFQNGGEITIEEFSKLDSDTQAKVLDFLNALPLKFELTVNDQKFVLVHATSERMLQFHDLDESEMKEFLVWDRESVRWIPAMGVHENEIVIFGHTPTCNLQNKMPLEIFVEDNIIGIDCGAAYPEIGRLACIRMEDMKVFYSK